MAAKPQSSRPLAARLQARLARRDRGFTLAEVLAALMLMAIVVGVGMEAMSVCARAGELGHRKAEAAQIGETALTEYVASYTAVGSTNNSGSTTRDGIAYPWTIRTETWTVNSLSLITVEVSFPVQGATHKLTLSTLLDTSTSD